MLTLSPAEDPLRIRIGIKTGDLETLREGVDRGLLAGAIATGRVVSRHDGSVLRATADEVKVAEPAEDTHYFDFNVATLREIRKRLGDAMIVDCINNGTLASQMPLDTPEGLLHDALNEAEHELTQTYEQQHGEPYPDSRPTVYKFPRGGY